MRVVAPLHPVPDRPPWLWATLDLYEQVRLMRLTGASGPQPAGPQKQRVNRAWTQATTSTGGAGTGNMHNFTKSQVESFFTMAQ